MPTLSIIIPHKSTPANDIALNMNIDMLMDYTHYSYELIIDTEVPKDPYKIWNEAAEQARGEILIFSNSDVLMGPGWDIPFVKHMELNAIIVGYLVEPGNIGVASENIQMDFGRTVSSFDVSKFERFVLKNLDPSFCKEERGWYMPCAMERGWFKYTGGFDTTLGFPNPNDILFWDRCVKEYKTKLLRVKSFAYHFQNLSGRS